MQGNGERPVEIAVWRHVIHMAAALAHFFDTIP